MLQIMIGLASVALFIGMSMVLKARGKPMVPDIVDSIEVFRGPSDAAMMAIDSLAEAGVAAWIENDDGDHAAVHVDQEAADQLPTLLRLAQSQRSIGA